MILKFRQRFLSFFDSYDIYDENGDVYYTVEGKISWGHKFHIYDINHELVAILKQRVFTFLPKLDIYDANENLIGTISQRFYLFQPKYDIDMNGWEIQGNFLEWDYMITKNGTNVAKISKQIFNFMDTYMIEVDKENALCALLVVVSIDAIKCTRRAINND